MRTFTVYPKGKAEPFDLPCNRFEIKDERFILYDSSDQESQDGFLSFSEVTAIIPDQNKSSYADKPIKFLVYLKDKNQPVEVYCSAFKINNDSNIVFVTQRRDIMHNIVDEWPISDVYVALSEVIAIVPSDGLVRRD
jgi:hypothetical protein